MIGTKDRDFINGMSVLLKKVLLFCHVVTQGSEAHRQLGNRVFSKHYTCHRTLIVKFSTSEL